jgi:serine/threonine protein kinase
MHATFQGSVKVLAEVTDEFCKAGTDFLLGLLEPDPSERMTAEDAVHHPFLTSPFLGADLERLPVTLKENRCVPENTFDRQLYQAIVDMCRQQ